MSNDKLSWIQTELDNLKSAGLYNTIRTIESPMDAWVKIDGRSLLNFCANNYLGLANHPRIREATKDAIDIFGVGPGAVRTIAGTMSLHIALEQRLAEFKRALPEAQAYYNMGYLHRLAGEWQQAGNCYKLALELDPDLGEAKTNLALCEQGHATEK